MNEQEAQQLEDIQAKLQSHRLFFETGQTRELAFRTDQLRRLRQTILSYKQQIVEALHQDLRKSESETYLTEMIIVIRSIDYTIRHLRKWMKPQKMRTPLPLLPSSSFIRNEPYGTVLIIGPFNYPFQLVIEPLIGAIAAGNCAIIKPSESTPHISALIKRLIEETFEPGFVSAIEGDRETTSTLIHAPVDYIFFTGSTGVGKIIMEAAAKRLVPVTLELGGKSPTIVDETAKLDIAAKRIVWGKLINTGQTCIAPDYLLVHNSVKQELIAKMKEAIRAFYGENPQTTPDYGRIVNERQFDRLAAIVEADRSCVVHGGKLDRNDLYIEPTLLDNINLQHASMQEELFGPLLPIIGYNSLDEAVRIIEAHPKPLALYLFTENPDTERRIIGQIPFGGGCVNDTIMHVANHHLPFGGVGSSGMGAYHGKHSFSLFSHQKTIVKKSTRIELGLAFPPYGNKLERIKKFLK